MVIGIGTSGSVTNFETRFLKVRGLADTASAGFLDRTAFDAGVVTETP